jgi:hypothetical protein
MTDSEHARRSDALDLLNKLFTTVGDAAIDSTLFDCSDKAFDAKNTSWDELCSKGLLLRLTDRLYMLTPEGWSEALIRARLTSSEGFTKRIGQLAKSLKDLVKGRHESAITSLDEIAKSSGLPLGWTFNAIDSHIISRVHGKRDAFWFKGLRGRLVEIPRDFGLVEVDLFADLRAENAKLAEQVESLNELYGDSRCSVCSAPLTGIYPWEHEYGSEEVREYACGMTIGAPNGDAPCTKSPAFPKFEDFTLITKQEGNGWWCHAGAAPKSRFAATINLPTTHGRTEEEAKEAMRERYEQRAAPWRG